MRSAILAALALFLFFLAVAAPASAALAPRISQRANERRAVKQQTVVVDPLAALDFSRQLCPDALNACPIARSRFTTPAVPSTLEEWIETGYECADFSSDVDSCGGCASLDRSRDCTAIAHAAAVSCVLGGCEIQSCMRGYARSADGNSCVFDAKQLSRK